MTRKPLPSAMSVSRTPARSPMRSPSAASSSPICKPASTICRRPSDADILVVLGGPIGVYEVDRYPFLRDEFAAVEKAIARGKPILGICLGAQAARGGAWRPRLSGPREGDRLGAARAHAGRPQVAARRARGEQVLGAALARRHLRPAARRDLACRDGDRAESGLQPMPEARCSALQFHAEQHAKGHGALADRPYAELTTAGVNLAKFRADTERLGPGLERAQPQAVRPTGSIRSGSSAQPSEASCPDLIRASTPLAQHQPKRNGMDCRVKPGNDALRYSGCSSVVALRRVEGLADRASGSSVLAGALMSSPLAFHQVEP